MFKLHILTVLVACRLTQSSPIDTQTLLSDALESENYDIVIDQRQNGTQNFRIKVSGLNIAIPDEDEEPPSQSPSSSAIALEQFASLLASQQSPISSGGISGNLDDFADIAQFFDFKKKGGEKKSPDYTQSRTKDIPTDSQLAESPKLKVKELVKEEQRRYKLLVGEKYIIPILRFLKKQTEDVKE